jgi:hypothetical protein
MNGFFVASADAARHHSSHRTKEKLMVQGTEQEL